MLLKSNSGAHPISHPRDTMDYFPWRKAARELSSPIYIYFPAFLKWCLVTRTDFYLSK